MKINHFCFVLNPFLMPYHSHIYNLTIFSKHNFWVELHSCMPDSSTMLSHNYMTGELDVDSQMTSAGMLLKTSSPLPTFFLKQISASPTVYCTVLSISVDFKDCNSACNYLLQSFSLLLDF